MENDKNVSSVNPGAVSSTAGWCLDGSGCVLFKGVLCWLDDVGIDGLGRLFVRHRGRFVSGYCKVWDGFIKL